jgi:hypothetical protein
MMRKIGIVIAVALALLIGANRTRLLLQARGLLTDGTAVGATITGKRQWQERARKGRQLDRFAVSWEFVDDSGTPRGGEEKVGEDRYPASRSATPGPWSILPATPRRTSSAAGSNDAPRGRGSPRTSCSCWR